MNYYGFPNFTQKSAKTKKRKTDLAPGTLEFP